MALKDQFPTPTVPLTAVLLNSQVFLPDSVHLHFMLTKGLRSLSLYSCVLYVLSYINPLNAKLNPIYHLLALLGARHIFHVSRLRVKIVSVYVCHMSGCFEMYCLCSGLVEINLIEQTQHINNKQYNNANRIK